MHATRNSRSRPSFNGRRLILLLDRLHLILHGRATDASQTSQEWRTRLVHMLADTRDDQLCLSSQFTLEITHLSIPGNELGDDLLEAIHPACVMRKEALSVALTELCSLADSIDLPMGK